ncbi:hypothetical protein A9G02_00175 [Cutibacterium avidum]|nr:hypothetical protein A9G02_00175 [Cutibacterium avidum]
MLMRPRPIAGFRVTSGLHSAAHARSSRAAVALVLMAFSVLAGERIYRHSILQTNGRVSVENAWRPNEFVARRSKVLVYGTVSEICQKSARHHDGNVTIGVY